jgi:hypothetical protein
MLLSLESRPVTLGETFYFTSLDEIMDRLIIRILLFLPRPTMQQATQLITT